MGGRKKMRPFAPRPQHSMVYLQVQYVDNLHGGPTPKTAAIDGGGPLLVERRQTAGNRRAQSHGSTIGKRLIRDRQAADKGSPAAAYYDCQAAEEHGGLVFLLGL